MGETRREFLGAIAIGATGLTGRAGEMSYRTLGRTGENVSLIGLGGYHIGMIGDEQESIRLVRAAIDNGINFMDNCWDYHDGASEIRMGKALRDGYRQRVFLMTKIDGQTRPAAAGQIEECLARLETDTIDLLQFHEVIRATDPDRIFGPNGAIEAVLAAKQAGKIRYIGFTGHKDPDIHLHMIETGLKHDFVFDAVQMPLNPMDPHFASFEKKVLPVLQRHRIGVLGMKPLGSGRLLKSNTVTATECLHYAMNLQADVVITGCESMRDLEQALEAARTFEPMKEPQVSDLLTRTAPAGRTGRYEEYKTTRDFDGTYHNPHWLG